MSKDKAHMIEFRDHMTVDCIQSMASDTSVVAAARVSTAADASRTSLESDAVESTGLINFLMKNRHGTPFEHNAFTFFVQAPIFVFREFMRHRIASYNEESGRYRQLRPIFYVPAEDRSLVQTGKPGHYEYVPGTPDQYQTVKNSIRESCETAYAKYLEMLDAGVAREVSRAVLPVNIYSSMYVTMNARALMNFLSLRTKRPDSFFPSYPQREIEMVAEQMEETFKSAMPITHQCFEKNGRVAP